MRNNHFKEIEKKLTRHKNLRRLEAIRKVSFLILKLARHTKDSVIATSADALGNRTEQISVRFMRVEISQPTVRRGLEHLSENNKPS